MKQKLIYEIKPVDVNSKFTKVLPTRLGYEVMQDLGDDILPIDVYKRLYIITRSDGDYYYAIENNEQRDRRVGKVI